VSVAHAFNKTGVYSLTSVCFVPGFYAASAAGATGAVAVANAPEVYAATAGDYATWYGRAVSWLSRMVGKTPTGAGTAIAGCPSLPQFHRGKGGTARTHPDRRAAVSIRAWLQS